MQTCCCQCQDITSPLHPDYVAGYGPIVALRHFGGVALVDVEETKKTGDRVVLFKLRDMDEDLFVKVIGHLHEAFVSGLFHGFNKGTTQGREALRAELLATLGA